MDQHQQSHDPSQVQPYDPSSYYPYHQYDQQYPYYYQQQQQQPPIHPPGVPIPPESQPGTGQINVQNQHYAYYTQGVEPQIQQFDPSAYPAVAVAPDSSHQQWQGDTGGYVPPVVHGVQYQSAPYASSGRRGGGPPRGGRSGTAFRGKGRGRGRGGNLAGPALRGDQQSGPVAWCELCRVDCNTLEILEQHKNGKKHLKNLKVREELQNLNNRLIEEQTQKVPVPPEESNAEETGQQKDTEEVEPSAETSRGHGGKRKMRGGGRGAGKLPRTSEGGPRRPIKAAPKPKMAPLVCEMCNVKCESEVVFATHIGGKKHLSKARRFQGQQEIIGQAALQALYPALQALYPALQALYPLNPDPTAFVPPLVSDQNPQPVPQTFHAAEGSGSAPVLENQDPGADLNPQPVPPTFQAAEGSGSAPVLENQDPGADLNHQPLPPTFHAAEGSGSVSGSGSVLENQDLGAEDLQVAPQDEGKEMEPAGATNGQV